MMVVEAVEAASGEKLPRHGEIVALCRTTIYSTTSPPFYPIGLSVYSIESTGTLTFLPNLRISVRALPILIRAVDL